MNGPLNADNLATTVEKHRISIEPGYLNYLRENGYNIEGLNEAHTVKRSSSETAHLVLNVTVTTKPTDHPEFDAVEDTAELWVCDCWDFRGNSAAVADGENVLDCGSCAHIRSVSKVANAMADENQDTLID